MMHLEALFDFVAAIQLWEDGRAIKSPAAWGP